jgi:hypothetical protein
MYLYWDKEELPDLQKIFKEDNTKLLEPITKKLQSIDWSHNVLADVFHLKFKTNSQVKFYFDIPFLLACIWYRLDEFEKSKKQIKEYLQMKEKQTKFHLASQQYIEMKSNRIPNQRIIETLKDKGYSEKILEQVSELFADTEKVLTNFKLPNCPFCEQCKLASHCVTKNGLRTIDKVFGAMKKVKIHQKNLSRLIN